MNLQPEKRKKRRSMLGRRFTSQFASVQARQGTIEESCSSANFPISPSPRIALSSLDNSLGAYPLDLTPNGKASPVRPSPIENIHTFSSLRKQKLSVINEKNENSISPLIPEIVVTAPPPKVNDILAQIQKKTKQLLLLKTVVDDMTNELNSLTDQLSSTFNQ